MINTSDDLEEEENVYSLKSYNCKHASAKYFLKVRTEDIHLKKEEQFGIMIFESVRNESRHDRT